jgi:hypothetical protein
MKERFDLASHLTYVVESLATDLTGEAKFELGRFIVELEASNLPDKAPLLAKLQEATDWFRRGDYKRASIVTVSANRKLQEGLVWPSELS